MAIVILSLLLAVVLLYALYVTVQYGRLVVATQEVFDKIKQFNEARVVLDKMLKTQHQPNPQVTQFTSPNRLN
jgi:hypothetical protein